MAGREHNVSALFLCAQIAVLSFLDSYVIAATQHHTNVLTWKDGRKAALTLTYDDNRNDHLSIAAPAMTARGLVGTFNVIPGVYTWDRLPGYQSIPQNGHELASHTMKHRRCDIKTPEEDPCNYYFHSLEELQQDCNEVKAILDPLQKDGRPTVSFTYPGGVWTKDTKPIIASQFLSARLSLSGKNVNDPAPPDMYKIKDCYVGYGTYPGWDNYDFAYGMLTWYMNEALNSQGWVVEEYHDIVWPGYSGLNLQAYYDHLDDLADEVNDGELWVATQGDVARYIYSRQASHIDSVSDEPNLIQFTLDDDLDDRIFDVPLTLKTEIPVALNPNGLIISHNGSQTAYTLIEDSGQTYLVYSLPADGNLVSIYGECQYHSYSDIDGCCFTNFADFALFALEWQSENPGCQSYSSADFNQDCVVDAADLWLFVLQWLSWGSPPP